jgi:hypothetical protein
MTATRLAAILAADVAGYSRLMGGDEEGTHERLKAHRRELVDPKISEHSGTLRRRRRVMPQRRQRLPNRRRLDAVQDGPQRADARR